MSETLAIAACLAGGLLVGWLVELSRRRWSQLANIGLRVMAVVGVLAVMQLAENPRAGGLVYLAGSVVGLVLAKRFAGYPPVAADEPPSAPADRHPASSMSPTTVSPPNPPK